MKKNLMVLFILVIIFSNFKIVYAETIDVDAPNINSIVMSKTEFVPSEEVSFTIDASDDISGIKDIALVFMKANDNSEKPNNQIYFNFNSEISNGRFKYTANVPIYAQAGEYKFYKAIITDNAGNSNFYIIYGGFSGWITENFNLQNITIGAYDGDVDAPILKSLTFDKNKIKARDSITVTAIIEDASKLGSNFIVFNHQSYLLTKVTDNEYTATIPFNTPGVYTFVEMQLYDEHDNLSYYRYKNNEMSGAWDNIDIYYTLEDGKYDVTVEGVFDKEAPVLNNIVFSKKSVNVPASFYAYVDAKDNMDDDLDVQIVVSKNDGSNAGCGECEAYYVGRENKKYVFQIVLGQYETAGKYSIVHVYLTDDSGNKVAYALQKSPYNDFAIMKDYSFEVVEDTIADVTTSTISNDFLEIIKKSDRGSFISIDTTKNTKIEKEIFEQIKEKENVINLETNGIQWIFDGKSITNPKDIDVSTKISFVEKYKNIGKWNAKKHKALVIEFKDNGKLPGKVLIRIKADYTFRNYIGIKNLNLYYMNNNNFDLISKGMHLTKDNYYEFYIDHNSVYFLSDDLISDEYVEDDYSESLGNDSLNESNNNVSTEVKEEITDNKVNNQLNDDEKNNVLEENNEIIKDNYDLEDDVIDTESNNSDNDIVLDDKISNKDIFIIIIVFSFAVIVGIIIFFKF